MSIEADPSKFQSDLERALCILQRRKIAGDGWLSAAEISRVLREDHELHVHWRSVARALDYDRDMAARRKRNRQWQYSILERGRQLIEPTADILFIEPAKALQSVVTLHELISAFSNPVRVVDPYLDASTLEHLDSSPKGVAILLLTHNIKDTGRLRQLITAFNASGRSIEIRNTAKAVLHDRYIIDGRQMVILGTSLNSFGKKQSFLIKAGQDMRATMLTTFIGLWATATPWPS